MVLMETLGSHLVKKVFSEVFGCNGRSSKEPYYRLTQRGLRGIRVLCRLSQSES
jgi:hypothetical protein